MISDGDQITDLIPPEVRHVHLWTKTNIGAKRNAGCEVARGDVIAHFDDDDFSAPGRLADQIERLRESGRAVTGYRSMRFTDGKEWWQYRGTEKYVVGTSLCYLRSWWQRYAFLPTQVGEDNQFVQIAAAFGQLAVAEDAGDLMWASVHPGNTSPRYTKAWKKIDAPKH